MKLIIIPPYRGTNYVPGKGQFMLRELLDNMEKKGQLKDVEIDVDEGHPFPAELESVVRTEELFLNITTGVLKRVHKFCETGKYDAIVLSGDCDIGFFAAREFAKIPVSSSIPAALHIASFIGERFTILGATDLAATIVRHYVERLGLSHKVVSVRQSSFSNDYMVGLIRNYEREERMKIPEVKEIINALTVQCIEAIEKDRADSIVFAYPTVQVYADWVRQELDEAGYGEIPIIGGLSAAVEMAKTMVSMKLTQAPRAYPSDALKAKPQFR